jgi:hypothetical protein
MMSKSRWCSERRRLIFVLEKVELRLIFSASESEKEGEAKPMGQDGIVDVRK